MPRPPWERWLRRERKSSRLLFLSARRSPLTGKCRGAHSHHGWSFLSFFFFIIFYFFRLFRNKLVEGHKRKLEEIQDQQREEIKRLRREKDVCQHAFEELMKKGSESQKQMSRDGAEVCTFVEGSEREYFRSIQKIKQQLLQLKKV